VGENSKVGRHKLQLSAVLMSLALKLIIWSCRRS